MNLEWSRRFSKLSLRQSDRTKWERPKKIPPTADTVKLMKHIEDVVENSTEIINGNGVTYDSWRQLAQATLCAVIAFNRWRPGETQYLEVKYYQERLQKGADFHDENFHSLPYLQQLQIKHLSLVMCRGKRGSGVPIILNKAIRCN